MCDAFTAPKLEALSTAQWPRKLYSQISERASDKVKFGHTVYLVQYASHTHELKMKVKESNTKGGKERDEERKNKKSQKKKRTNLKKET